MNNTKNNTMPMPNANNKWKTIFSLRVRAELKKRGFEPLVEVNNFKRPGYRCWKYEDTEQFEEALSDIMKEG